MEEAEGRRRLLTRSSSRKPLSDRTNTCHDSSLLLRNPTKKPGISSSSSSSSPNPATKRASAATVPTTNLANASRNSSSPPPSVVPAPSSPKTSYSYGIVDLEASEPISVVYSRRSAGNKRKDKGKAVAFPISITPTPKISDTRQKSDVVEGANPPKAKALTAPCRKKRRAVSSEEDMFKDPLLQDYVEKQKAYFKMIDEFELSEEEVETIDELD